MQRFEEYASEKDIEYWLAHEIKELPGYSGRRNFLNAVEKVKLSGKWSRELSKKDRVIYSIEGDTVKIHSIPGHYKK